jgi:glycosyltransferase involved in cell wall biosynthesis
MLMKQEEAPSECKSAAVSSDVRISVVIPVFNEEENLRPLTAELVNVLDSSQKSWEIIFVNDGSSDGSGRVLRELGGSFPRVRVITFKRNCGQTAAFDAGFKAARGGIIITMDADLQNDPSDIPRLLEQMGDYDAACGWRHRRNDPFIKLISSRIANYVRNKLSDEDIKDVGCSLKAFKTSYVKKLKLYSGMHRFFPTLIKMEGGRVVEVKVNHRPRKHGLSKYNIRNRMMRSFMDLLAVRWMKKRKFNYEIAEGEER